GAERGLELGRGGMVLGHRLAIDPLFDTLDLSGRKSHGAPHFWKDQARGSPSVHNTPRPELSVRNLPHSDGLLAAADAASAKLHMGRPPIPDQACDIDDTGRRSRVPYTTSSLCVCAHLFSPECKNAHHSGRVQSSTQNSWAKRARGS